MMSEWDIAELVRARRRECGIGLCGSIDALVKWLRRTHNIITDHKTVEWWLKKAPPAFSEDK